MLTKEDDHVTSRQGAKKSLVCALLVLATMAISLTAGLLFHFYYPREQSEEILVEAPFVDCQPEKVSAPDASEEICKRRGCVWRAQHRGKVPKCVYPPGYGYKVMDAINISESGMRVKLTPSHQATVFGMTPFRTLFMDAEYQSDNRLRIKIYPDVERFEVPKEALNIESPADAPKNSSRLYEVTIINEPIFGVVVQRRSTNATVFNTTLPGFVVADQFLQITTRLSNSYVYGFGEHRHETFRHDMNWRTWSIFTRDNSPDNDWNIYGAHPVYLNVEDDGKANMVFLKNSNAMEVTLQPDPTPAITFRTIGGVLDFYIFLGSSPGDAVSQYTEAIGRPVLPPYWALGFQLSRWGYIDIHDMWTVINRTRAAQIPYDVQWADIDCLFNKYVFTYDRTNWTGLPALVDDLHTHHQHFVIIVDPGVGANLTINAMAKNNSPGYTMFEDGEAADIFVKDSSGKTLIGEVWPGVTAYPDYTNISVLPWFEKYVQFFREKEGVKVDALWIDMNEPSSFVPGSTQGCEKTQWDYPPYVPNILGASPEGKMFDKTICMTALHSWGRHYDVHSLYAHAMAMRTVSVLRNIFPGKRPWTMTRSSFAGTGRYATKWMGDNRSHWREMHWSIIGIMEFGLFGFALNGADICGFWYETTYELCIRWHQLGAFYPFARNHNGRGDPPVIFRHQDPASFDQRFVDIIKRPLTVRYKLLPYLYTLMYRAHTYGDTVLRPLLFEFPQDLNARDIDRQFLLGPALLVSPVLTEGAREVEAYFPSARWYDYFTGREVLLSGKWQTCHTPLESFNLHVRGGHVIPWQAPSLTTYESRQNAMGLLVALDDSFLAQGELFMDDGESDDVENSTYLYTLISFNMWKAGELMIQPNVTTYSPPSTVVFDTVEIIGLGSSVTGVLVDGLPLGSSQIVFIDGRVQFRNLNLTVLTPHTVRWTAAL